MGTICQNKPDILAIYRPSKSREVYSSDFGFYKNMVMVSYMAWSKCAGVTFCFIYMVSYVPKKGKAVVLLSSMHDDKVVDDGVKRKPEIIQHYKRMKGGVDMMDQMVHTLRMLKEDMVLWHKS